jgi:hypothetical protein
LYSLILHFLGPTMLPIMQESLAWLLELVRVVKR